MTELLLGAIVNGKSAWALAASISKPVIKLATV
ncbi:hypothetical protein SAMN05216529_11520 [Faecalicatena contorta]|uniref:Uncharacterized protein n=1 Tax=Faecalicatena contorta TaxID=39482 RepID=A0A315ZQQ0_9FIRM|nr:hypothetical protein A8805_11520 [Faecalicatena contorta]SUQ15664.1 hypothetical protein SAMN05216529_11520 [Faecalicatena contorta]